MKRRLLFGAIVLASLAGFAAMRTAPVDQAHADGLSISGFVWDDRNADGVRQTDEPPLEFISMQLGRVDTYGAPQFMDTGGIDLYRDAAGRFGRTDSFGRYEFANLDPGSYVVRVTPTGGGTPFFLTHPHRQATGNFAVSVILGEVSTTAADLGLHRLQNTPEFSGNAWINASEVIVSLQVRAFIGDVDCTTGPPTIVPPHVSRFSIGVAPSSLIPGCGEAGKTITFTVNGRLANETATWQAPQTESLPGFAMGRFRLTVGAPFAVFNLNMVGDDGLSIYVPELVVEAVIDGAVCGRSELFGQGGTGVRVVLRSKQAGGCGYESALIVFHLNGNPVGVGVWFADDVADGPTIRVGRATLSPPAGPANPTTLPTVATTVVAPPSLPSQPPADAAPGIRPPSVGDGGLLGR